MAVKVVSVKFAKEVSAELSALRKLDEHPNIVSFYETVNTDAQWIFIVMSLCVIDLSKLYLPLDRPEQVRVQLLCRNQETRILSEICAGLSFIHKVAKFTHRDLKPANILLNDKVRAAAVETSPFPFLTMARCRVLPRSVTLA